MRPYPFDGAAGSQKLKCEVTGPEHVRDEFPHTNFQFAFQFLKSETLNWVKLGA
jgi:hypothetical protein